MFFVKQLLSQFRLAHVPAFLLINVGYNYGQLFAVTYRQEQSNHNLYMTGDN